MGLTILLKQAQFWQYRKKRIVPPGLDKIGVWFRMGSFQNRAAIETADWVMIEAGRVGFTATQSPVYATVSIEDDLVFRTAVCNVLGPISGVVWDYEPKGNTVQQSDKVLQTGYNFAKERGLTVAVSCLGDPDTAKKYYGVDYSHAHLWSDFIMPQLYAQLWACDPKKVLKKYKAILKASSVPVVPLIAYETTKNNPGPLSPDDLVKCYGQLSLPCMGFWNVGKSEDGFWEAVKKL